MEMGRIIQDFQLFQEDIFQTSSNILGKSVLFGVIQVSVGIKQLLKFVVLMEDLPISRYMKRIVGHTFVV